MNTFNKSLVSIVTSSLLFVSLVGCQKQEGPAEKAGQAIDNAAGKVGAQIEKAGEAIQDAAKGEKK